jgi:hypothetical protein
MSPRKKPHMDKDLDWDKHYDRDELNTLQEAQGVLANVQRTFNNVTLDVGGTFGPGAAGWLVSAPTWISVELDLTVQAADLADATLTIVVNLEWTTDATGATGWDILTGGGWVGGDRVRNGTVIPAQQPLYSLTPGNGWPAGLAALRLHAIPTRQVRRVDAEISAS